MAAPNFSAADFVAAMQRLLPQGRVWPREPETNLSKLLLGLALVYEGLTDRANYLLIDAFPASSAELLGEWEETLGLPDPCLGASPTLDQRRASVVAKLVSLGGQSVPYFIVIAAKLGYTITVTEFSPFRVTSTVVHPLYDERWAHAWQVNAPLSTVTLFRVTSGAGDALAEWGNTLLECVLRELMPAHTILQFAYGP